MNLGKGHDMIPEEELKVQIALGTFPKNRLTINNIKECTQYNVLRLIAYLWVRDDKKIDNECRVKENERESNDKVTNILLTHPLADKKLRNYIMVGKIYRTMLNSHARLSQIVGVSLRTIQEQLKRLEIAENELFKD